MQKSKEEKEVRRRLLLRGGLGLFGVASVLGGWMAARGRAGAEARAVSLVRRMDLPRGADAMMRAFARDPEKVARFRELTRWRKMRDEELRKV